METTPAFEELLEVGSRTEALAPFLRLRDFVQQLPQDGAPASHATEAYLAYGGSDFHVVFVAHDDHPDQVRARMVPRENISGDDAVTILLDTDHDGRRAYAFRTNPRGVQWDALWTEGQGFDVSFDAVWRSRGTLTADGYVVWMSIPFKSLRFDPGSTTWNVVLSRSVPRAQGELSYWPRVSSGVEGLLTQAAELHGVAGVSPGRNLQAIPYTSFRSFRAIDERVPGGPDFVDDPADASIGLDVKQVLDDRFVIDLTANPDFSQVESDQPQVTVNRRFEVFFPERRPFFIENADYFRTPLTLLFTRRVADPRFGGRVTGRAGAWSMAGLLVDDRAPGQAALAAPEGAGTAAVSAVRVMRDLGQHSRVGALYAGRRLGSNDNRVGGVDARLRMTEQWTGSGQMAWSRTGLSGSDAEWARASTVSVSRPGTEFSYFGSFTEIEADFRPEVGFAPRTDIRRLSHFASWFKRSDGTLLFWGPELFVQHVWDYSGLLTDQLYEPSLEWSLVGNTNLEINYRYAKEKLRPVDFPALDGVREFDVSSWDLEFGTAYLDWAQIGGNFRFGKRTNFSPPAGQAPSAARWRQLNLGVSLRPGAQLRVDNRLLLSHLRAPGTGVRVFDDLILRSAWNWQFTRRLSARAIVQYERTRPNPALTALTRRENFNGDVLLTYRVDPWTAVFVGYNGNLQNRAVRSLPGGTRELIRTQDLKTDARQFFVKVSYLLRM